jgi:hypothetical protein
MKFKIVPLFTLLVAFAVGGTGCMCTSTVLRKCNKTTVDTFSPSAVYQKTNQPTVYALEGINHNYDLTSSRAYLIVSHDILISWHRTNDITSLDGLKKWQYDLSQEHAIPYQTGLELKRKLPPHYQKIIELPQNDISIYVGEGGPNTWMVILLPFTVVADIATFPVQVILVASHPRM